MSAMRGKLRWCVVLLGIRWCFGFCNFYWLGYTEALAYYFIDLLSSGPRLFDLFA